MELVQREIPDSQKTLLLRPGTADLVVYDSIIQQQEYGHIRFIEEPKIIVDAGAEIGLASIWFSVQYPGAKIYAIEPAPDNFAVLQKNAELFPNIIPIHSALMAEEGSVSVVDPGIGVLGYRVQVQQEQLEQNVAALTMDSLCQQYGIDHIDFLKVDIEGSEIAVFNHAASWLDRVSAMVIELHERLNTGCNYAVFQAVKPHFSDEWIGGENVYFARRGVAEPIIPECYKVKNNPALLPAERVWQTEERLMAEQLNGQRERHELHTAYQTQISEINGELQKVQAYASELVQQLHQSHETGSAINEQLQQSQRAYAGLNEQLQQSQKACADLNEQLRQSQDDCISVKDRLQQSQEMCNDLKGQLYSKQQECNTLSGQVQLNWQQAQYWAGMYSAVVNSRFWRFTEPVRKLLLAMKYNKVTRFAVKGLRFVRHNGLRAAFKKVWERLSKKKYRNLAAKLNAKNLAQFAVCLRNMGCKIAHSKQFTDASVPAMKGKILLVIHELGLTGAPVALGYFAEETKQLGYLPIVISPRDGALFDRLKEQDIPVVLYTDLFQTDFVSRCAGLFDLVVICTNVGAPLVAQLSGTDTPVLWWIHEAEASYHPGAVAAMPDQLADNIHVYCGGNHAEKMLKKYRPAYQAKQLLYYVPDYAQGGTGPSDFTLGNTSGKYVFVIAGMQELRKGQDLVVQAIRRMDSAVREKCLFVFVGRTYHIPIWDDIRSVCQEYPQSVRYIEELGRGDFAALYRQMDCLICASRDDPMPIVVAEAMLMSKLIICSENAGSAALLEQMNAGIVYHNNDVGELINCISFVCQNQVEVLDGLRSRARNVYEHYFTRDVFSGAVSGIIKKLVSKKQIAEPFTQSVSVVIPAYNAGAELDPLMEALKGQRGIGKLEIVLVDSESRDGTAERAEAHGAKVIRIKQSEFSHSYARNLGAQHAEGEYLLFMTQDAMPSGPDWIYGLLEPAVHEGVVAVSCQETPRPECDLLGRVSIWNHSEYMGILQTDRITSLPASQGYDGLRRNGQLNDVTCLIRRDVFMQFKYRGDYAEDLDMGIRLLQAGYKLALLSSVQVVHSHTRRPLYHMKRCLVDVRTLKNILPDMPTEEVSEQLTAGRIVASYCALLLYLETAMERTEEESLESFVKWTEGTLAAIKKTVQSADMERICRILKKENPFIDPDVSEFVKGVFEGYRDQLTMDTTMVDAISHYLIRTIPRYLSVNETPFTQEVKEEVLDAAPKHLSMLHGTLMASYAITCPDEVGLMHELIKKYSAGV